jgi:hypothetical protein
VGRALDRQILAAGERAARRRPAAGRRLTVQGFAKPVAAPAGVDWS